VSGSLDVDQQALEAFCEEHHIARLAFFGSVLTDEFGPDSDVDVLVEFEEDHVPGFFGLVRMERALGHVLGVEDVDLHTPGSINQRFRDEVLASAEDQYAQA
jgi:predicted nucleotidyltransferase